MIGGCTYIGAHAVHRLNVQGPRLALKFSFITIVIATEVEACVHHVRSLLLI